MFKKALAHQSNANPIRSSARRSLVNDIFTAYPAFLAAAPSHETKEQAAEREKAERELGKLIVPEGIRQVSVETSGGVAGCLYLSPDNGDPFWMSFGTFSRVQLIPTLYALALPLPRPPLPILRLHYPLPPPILNGAPLFIGAVKDLAMPWLLPDVPEGGIVAFVTSQADDHSGQVHYVGVGRMAAAGGMRGALDKRRRIVHEGRDVEEGKFCDILCITGDHLWEMGSKVKVETFLPEPPLHPLEPLPNQERNTSAGPSSRVPDQPLVDELSQLSLRDGTPAKNDQIAHLSLSSKEISTLLSVSLLQALSDLDSTVFPMPASTLYSAHILPNRPAYIPREQREEVVIGKSEWKKLAKWMKDVAKEGLIKIKESKGEVIVVGCDSNHPSIQGHVPFQSILREENKTAKKAAQEVATQEETPGMVHKGKGREIAIEELWRPSSGNYSFFEACGISTEMQSAQSLRPIVEDYIAKQHLADPRNPRMVILDESLGRAVGIKTPDPGQTLARDEIIKRLKAGVTWSVSIGGQIKKGTMQPITLSVKQRQGRKVVTLVSGLETFGVDVEDLAEDLKKLCAGSASVQPLTGASPKLNLKEIMVQGSQVKVITDALIAKGVPKRWIREGEGEKKKK